VLNDPRGRYVVSAERQQSRSEYPISTLRADGRLAEYIVDRTYLEDDVRWVVDYKSSSPLAGESIEDFCRREADRYGPQLAGYAKTLSAMDNRQVKCALYFTSIPHWLPLQPAEPG
jgi:ATP-dependent helicase/nuclease subunit A